MDKVNLPSRERTANFSRILRKRVKRRKRKTSRRKKRTLEVFTLVSSLKMRCTAMVRSCFLMAASTLADSNKGFSMGKDSLN